jgi:formiminotetrahydrofolate cyclodeaminase
VPAGVAVSVVTASLALALLAKVLEITGKRKQFVADQRVAAFLDAARRESTELMHYADDDIRAFNDYMDCVRRKEPIEAAMRKAIEVPMNAARAAVRGLDLCAEGAGMVQGLTAADLGSVAALLSGAIRAMLLSVDFNLRLSPSEEVISERRELERRAQRQAEAVEKTIALR